MPDDGNESRATGNFAEAVSARDTDSMCGKQRWGAYSHTGWMPRSTGRACRPQPGMRGQHNRNSRGVSNIITIPGMLQARKSKPCALPRKRAKKSKRIEVNPDDRGHHHRGGSWVRLVGVAAHIAKSFTTAVSIGGNIRQRIRVLQRRPVHLTEAITIGVDHGYAAMKSKNFSFPTGLVGYDHEPYTQQNVLEYGGKYEGYPIPSPYTISGLICSVSARDMSGSKS